MAQCVHCNTKGFFLAVSSKGLCTKCEQLINLDMHQRMRIVIDSHNIVRDSKNIETIISRSDLAIDHLNELSQYDKYAIIDTSYSSFTSFSSLAKEIFTLKVESIFKVLKANYESVKVKLLTLSTVNTKVNQLNKLKVEVQKYYPLIKSYEVDVNEFISTIDKEISKIKSDDALDKAKKYEFKGDKKKALDCYYESLYLLKTDNVDDKEQNEKIIGLENKIKSLGGELREI